MDSRCNARAQLSVGDADYAYCDLKVLEGRYDIQRLPYSLKILLENLLRNDDGVNVTKEDIEALAGWDPKAEPSKEIAFTPARVLLQDFTGVPAVVDLAAMRDAIGRLGGEPSKINPLSPAELVVDHSVQVDVFARPDALQRNAAIEFERNEERYGFLRWGQQAFANFRVVPPDTGIVHQVNLEYLARVVFSESRDGVRLAYPDTLVGTDTHTPMINGLGVLGWGVGGIEAEAAMLGQSITMLIPQVVGFKFTGKLPEGATATDLVLTVTQMLRAKGVVGKFVEFFGPGLDHLPLADRATIANMAPEYGATCGIFPIDAETIRYLRLSGRSPEQIALTEAYAKVQGLWRDPKARDAEYSDTLALDIGTVEPSLAGPKRPQDRVALKRSKAIYREQVASMTKDRAISGSARVRRAGGEEYELKDGAVVIAAITSCTNTSNPSVMVGAGLVAKIALERGLKVKPWVKSSLAPGSKVVTEYLQKTGLTPALDALGFQTVGYGCTTCIGNSGPLPPEVSAGIRDGNLAVVAVLSGNRNFEGRVHAEVKMNYLASPPLVVVYAIAGTMDIDLYQEPLSRGADGAPVYFRDLWPSQSEIQEAIARTIDSAMFRSSYQDVFAGDTRWAGIKVAASNRFQWREDSTYVRNPPYFHGMSMEIAGFEPIRDARCLALLGDSITTDHISPAGSIKPDGPAGRYLIAHGVLEKDFNSYGARRGNHEVMMRGTFANIRLRNQLVPGVEGGWTSHLPCGEKMSIYDASMRYQSEGVPLLVIAGAEYGTGSSRDWAAKGTRLLGVRAVLAESFERIHRSNLVGMGVLPLCFKEGENAEHLRLSGKETYDIEGLVEAAEEVTVIAKREGGEPIRLVAKVRIDTPKEWEYFNHGGILPYVLRQLAA